MNPGKNKSGSSEPMTSANWFVMGSVISLVSALVLAWKGAICVEVLKILVARDLSDIHAIGQQLGRVCWCPLGVAVGTTLVAAGFRLAAARGRLSQRALAFLALYGVVAAIGAYFVLQGTSQSRAAMEVIQRSQSVKPEEVLAAIAEDATTASRGWALLMVAQSLLVIGGFFQLVDQSKPSVGSLRWHKVANMALSLLWIFGAVASIAWFRRSSEMLELRLGEPIKAAAVVEMFDGVVSMSWFASLFLLGHAALATVVVAVIYRTLARARATHAAG